MTATFVIVRHGNTFAPGDAARRIGLRTDIPLVDSGIAQAQALGAHFATAAWRFDRILCSPLRRTRETAALIRASLPGAPDPEQSSFLAEIDHGPDENQPEPTVIDRIGMAALDAWDRDGTPPAGWVVDRDARLESWGRLYTESRTHTTLLVTSNGAARFALLTDPALHAQALRLPSLKLRTGAFGIVRVANSGAELVVWDRRP